MSRAGLMRGSRNADSTSLVNMLHPDAGPVRLAIAEVALPRTNPF
jgi:hypothetical protein